MIDNNLNSTVSIEINAPASKVWDGLTNPAIVKQYFFGTEVKSNWKVGSSVTWSGEWKGQVYQDKGEVLEVEPEKLLVMTYWSAMSGLPDQTENYKTITYKLEAHGDKTKLTLTQDNNKTQQEAEHSTENWKTVLEGLKKLLEK